MLISRMLYGLALLLAVRDLEDAIKINILALGSVQLISILLEFNFVNNSLKTLASSTNDDPQRYLTFLLIPIAPATVCCTFLYAISIFGFEDLYIAIGCSCFIALQQLTKIPDISMKMKGLLKSTYIIEAFSAFLQIVIVISLDNSELLSARNVMLTMIITQLIQLLVKSYIKSRIIYSNNYTYSNTSSTLYNFYRPSFKFATTTFSTTLFVSLIVPLIAVSLSDSQGYFLLLVFRVITYCDQLSWSSFYARLPLIHHDFRADGKLSIKKYSYAAKKVLLIFLLLSLAAVSILFLPSVQQLLDYQISAIIIPLLIVMLFNRAVAMNMQILFAIKNIEAPYAHLIMTFLSLTFFAIQPDYLFLSFVIYLVSLMILHIVNYREIRRNS